MATDDYPHQMVADLLAARTGQQLTESRRWRITTALSGVFREYGISNLDQLACILADPREHQIATKVVEALVNNETYFFRDHAYFQTLAHTVLPDLAKKRESSRKLNIWSAGCSTGQEALSLAMMLTEQAGRWQGWDIQILATDVSSKAIETAKAGIYTQFEIQRGLSVAHMLNYFSEVEGGWQVNERIRSMIKFQKQNILDLPPLPGRFDLVLCRNVLLYFDPKTKRAAFDRLASATAPDGLLMLGAGETVVGQTERFETAPCGSALYRLRTESQLERSLRRAG